jgi:hypothetical protein
MEKKDQTKILTLGAVIVILLIGLISWVINVHEPSKESKKNKNTIIQNHETSTITSDSITIKPDSNQIERTKSGTTNKMLSPLGTQK